MVAGPSRYRLQQPFTAFSVEPNSSIACSTMRASLASRSGFSRVSLRRRTVWAHRSRAEHHCASGPKSQKRCCAPLEYRRGLLPGSVRPFLQRKGVGSRRFPASPVLCHYDDGCERAACGERALLARWPLELAGSILARALSRAELAWALAVRRVVITAINSSFLVWCLSLAAGINVSSWLACG